MARLPRLALPGHPHHLMLRGNGGQAVVRDGQDGESLLALLGEYAQSHRVLLHAYLFLPDQVHLLATPQAQDSLPLWVQGMSRRYVRGFNDRHGRRGTLWEGRYRSQVLEAGRWLLPSMVALDLLPVRTGLAPQPQDHAWGSHRHYVGLQPGRFLTPPAVYWELGNTPFAREAAYAELVRAGLDAATQLQLEESWRGEWALGSEAFVASAQKLTPRRLRKTRAGRPAAPRENPIKTG
ncbi:transposase [Xylophilus sp. ASV27]|uniref:transposase n=1 Tax=Xylophilus sp. ASV27 TaxID=2795129 RepID=UPI0018ED8582|nr:transposase [Xylophilus sp. ASV27]